MNHQGDSLKRSVVGVRGDQFILQLIYPIRPTLDCSVWSCAARTFVGGAVTTRDDKCVNRFVSIG
jgi:hypothetical protein